MIVKSLSTDGFRNLKNIDMKFHPRLNVLFGKNAQGKTNILESLWLCSGERSFRGAKDRELIDVSGSVMNINMCFEDKQREQTVRYSLDRSEIRNKKIELNGVNVKTPSGLFGAFQCVIFTPEDLELSKGSPDNRRSFMDMSVSQLKASYRRVADKYRRLLEQRNTQLKHIASGKADRDMLDVWDMQLAQMGAYISMLRYNYCKKLKVSAAALYDEISGGAERLDIEYHSTVYDTLEGRNDYKLDLASEYYEKLSAGREDDIRAGFTLRGVHRDDLYCSVNGMYAKDYASQGQHRSIALILKLAQAYILTEESGDPPCILLDDVLSELDCGRQSFVMNKISNMQVIITCCDEDLLKTSIQKERKLFQISNGKVI